MPGLVTERYRGKKARFSYPCGAFYIDQDFLAEQHIEAVLEHRFHVYQYP